MKIRNVLNLETIVLSLMMFILWLAFFSNGTWQSWIISFGVGWMLGTSISRYFEEVRR